MPAAGRQDRESAPHGDAAFIGFATTRARRRREFAYLMCGDWHQAQDLTQQTLAKTYVAWRRIQRDNVDAYARAVLVREFPSERRRRRSTERPMATLPDRPAPADKSEAADHAARNMTIDTCIH